MPQLSLSFPHTLPQAEALRRVKTLLGQLQSKYAGQIRDLQETWGGTTGSFRFSILGFAITGSITVRRGIVALDGSLPIAAFPWKRNIESTIRRHAASLLA